MRRWRNRRLCHKQKEFSIRQFRSCVIRRTLNLVFLTTIFALSSCSTPIKGYSISVPVEGGITEPFPYPNGDLAGTDFNGTITALAIGDQLNLSNSMYPRLGSDRLTCWGDFSRNPAKKTFSFPLHCTNGRYGTATITIAASSPGQASNISLGGHSPTVGVGTFQLADKSTGEFAFVDTTIIVYPVTFPDPAGVVGAQN